MGQLMCLNVKSYLGLELSLFVTVRRKRRRMSATADGVKYSPEWLVKHSNVSVEEKLVELRLLMGKAEGHLREKAAVRIWRRSGRSVDRATAEHLFEVINAREDVLRRLIRRCAYLKYVEGRLGDRILFADEILRDGFCLNMIDTPLCPLKVVTNLQEAVWDADIVVNGLPSTETRVVFEEISRYWRDRKTMPIIVSLSKGVELAELAPAPRIVTPTQMIQRANKADSHFMLQ
ncbi:probable glycerol-3-phosphate dehydrogenase [NAD(+)] 2, cytosolic [Rosa chinensis]|uniref:probable glycerol-3-phosphate dehydrogenase [NAD(+)] 2, cytosolic n=1 Tax=Rosa chinensis TaxID=74649 RepID=UPI000D092290|nr:probable glycerol-3-phosphate dehydrogenase [NAD(+)] 2, cytosolic [Rosa chinensis]